MELHACTIAVKYAGGSPGVNPSGTGVWFLRKQICVCYVGMLVSANHACTSLMMATDTVVRASSVRELLPRLKTWQHSLLVTTYVNA